MSASRIPSPVNEPNLSYLPGSPERAELKSRLSSMASERVEIPLVIGGCDVRTGRMEQAVMPHDHRHVLADWHKAGPQHVEQAISAAADAHREWAAWTLEERAGVFLRAAELLSTTWRSTLNAATMLGQSKTVFQAEIDSASELIDFWRFNPSYAFELRDEQPISTRSAWNRMDYRPLEGFVYAVTPFNFTSIAGNLPTAPALMGNTVLWKPASSAVLSAYYIMRLLQHVGLPPGVINFLPGDPVEISRVALDAPALAGIHFTGSTPVFQGMWTKVSESIGRYKNYPRLVGETGGKNFIVAHVSAEVQELAVAIVRGAFEYQGQKCSAPSRVYVPRSLWPEVRDRVISMMREMKMGDPCDFTNFIAAVIDRKAFSKITGYIDDARRNAKVLHGGGARDDAGYFIEPALVETADPHYRLMQEEVFGPVVCVYPYSDDKWDETLQLIDETSPYGLTGAVFSRDRSAIHQTMDVLRNAAGNFYINDKPTGAIVAQQPFGGARASGTNDKAGSKLNLVRWASARAIKETFVPPRDFRYPYMSEE
ncbi:MAG: L-glutamate gamma-semialdehyde dehydrogenase [Vicinamibacterales bacterium]